MSTICCPICGMKFANAGRLLFANDPRPCTEMASDGEYTKYWCGHYNFEFSLHGDLLNDSFDLEVKDRVMDLATEYMLRAPKCKSGGQDYEWHFFFDKKNVGTPTKSPEFVNLANLIDNYPVSVLDVANRSLINYSLRYPHYGDVMTLFYQDRRMSFEHEINNTDSLGVIRLLEDMGFVKDLQNQQYYAITASGWLKIDDLRKKEQIVQQGFIAMSFRDETAPIREAFRKAITESGYSVAIIDEKEHNNQIVPEIFYEIERSKFVVVDVTYPNYGAYYEAGYAQALGKQVIICCRAEEFSNKEKEKRPHFDISQKSMIVWNDEADLIQRLKRRIQATVHK